MSDILAKLRAVHAKSARQRVDVPEYGFVWYFRKLTAADRIAINRGVKPNDETGLAISAVMHLAETEDGTKVFDVPVQERAALKAELHQMEMSVLMRVMRQANGGLSQSAATEIVAFEGDMLRSLADDLVETLPILSQALREAEDTVIQSALGEIVSAYEEKADLKNG